MNYTELSMLGPEPRQVYNCDPYSFSEICIPLKNETALVYGRPHLNLKLSDHGFAFESEIVSVDTGLTLRLTFL